MSFTKEQFDAVHVGQKVTAVSGPGEDSEWEFAVKKGQVTEKVENRWGFHLVVKGERVGCESGDWVPFEDTVSGFVTVGIGWYLVEEK